MLCSGIVAHLVSKPTSYPLNRPTSDSTPKRGHVCQQLIHHAQYQLISKHKQNISDIRDSWIRGGTVAEMHLYASRPNSLAAVCCPLSPRLAWFSRVARFLQLFYFRSTTRPEPIAPWHRGVDSNDSSSSPIAEPRSLLTHYLHYSTPIKQHTHAKQMSC